MKIGLRIKFLVPLMILVAAGMAGSLLVSNTVTRSTLDKNAKDQVHIHAESSAAHLASWVRRGSLELGNWAQEKVYGNALPDTFMGKAARIEVLEKLQGIQQKYSFFDIITLYDIQGKALVSSNLEAANDGAVNRPELIKAAVQEVIYVSKVFKSPLTGSPAVILSCPVKYDDQVLGLLAGQINVGNFRSQFLDRITVAKTGRAFLINANGLVVSYPHEEQQDSPEFTLNFAEAGLGLNFADSGKELFEHNFQGQKHITALKKVDGTDIYMVVTAPAKEIMASATRISWIMAGIGFAVVVLLGLSGWFLAGQFISKPSMRVAEGLKSIAQGGGDLSSRLPVTSSDELGILAGWFNMFMENQQHMVTEILETANSLASLTAQISATSSQFATSATEMVSSVTEISTTSEEVKETVRLSCEKAEGVADSAEETEKVSQAGLSATDKSLAGMHRIREEMEYIAESIVKLSEQTQNIAEIIDAVNELANQSNLLSVNASIEAAKAGEFGKGFAVVAQEVKSLSDQSKQATHQVKGILHEIQNATSAAVMATERGSKAVDDGSDLSAQAEGAIRKLSTSTGESAKSSRQIAASSQQQLAGMEQLADALESIKYACQQNVESAKQLEDSTTSLMELGQALKSMAGRFKV